MEELTKKTNWFVRVLISIFCLILAGMILYRYFHVEPRGNITAGIITLLCLLLILVLSESFDSFSVGKLISVSREIKKKENEVEKLEKHNSHLLSQLISISNTQTQNQIHTNVYGDYHTTPTVQKASESEVQKELSSSEPTEPRISINMRKVEELALKKYLQQRAIHQSNAITKAKLVSQFQGIDPISSIQPVFDAYIKENGHETFVEFCSSTFIIPNRLYVMLSKINLYQTAKRVDAHLDLVLIKFSSMDELKTLNKDVQLRESFEPSIASGLLKIHEIEFTSEETALCKSDSQTQPKNHKNKKNSVSYA